MSERLTKSQIAHLDELMARAQEKRKRGVPVQSIEEIEHKLSKLVPNRFVSIEWKQRAYVNRPDHIKPMADEVKVYVEGGYWFYGSTLQQVITKVREWVERMAKTSNDDYIGNEGFKA